MGRDLRSAGRADPDSPDHAGICKHAPLIGTRDARAGRASGRERGAAASWQPFASLAPERGGATEERRIAGGGGHGIARAGHRHRLGGSGVPDWVAALDRGGAAARGPVGPLGGRKTEGTFLHHHARRADRMRCPGPVDSFRRAGSVGDPHSASRHTGPADCGRNRRSRLAGRRSLRAGARYVSLSRSRSQTFRRDYRNAVGRHLDRSAAAAVRTCIAIR